MPNIDPLTRLPYDPRAVDFVQPRLNGPTPVQRYGPPAPGVPPQYGNPQLNTSQTQSGYQGPPAVSHQTHGESSASGRQGPISVQDLFGMICELRDDIVELKGENLVLKQTVNVQMDKIAALQRELDELAQYGRRENVVFSNLKFDDTTNLVNKQVIELCNDLGVTVEETDFVDVNPLPASKGRAKRVIARFRDRKLAQKVMGACKHSKQIAPDRKKVLASDPSKGFGIQPNITPRRAALLGQAKAAVDFANFNSVWVDTKNGSILIRKDQGSRPFAIRSTADICNLVPNFVPNDYIFCVREKFDVFNVSVCSNVNLANAS